MKKWMAYLPLGLLCGSLVVIGGIWGSVWNHTWSGQLELRHLKGDQSALADLNIQFGITDVRQRWNFSIKNGVLQKESFTLSYEEPVYGSGENIGNWKDGTMQVWNEDVTFQPAADSKIENLDMVDLSLLKEDVYISPELYDDEGNLHGTTCIYDKGQLVLNMDMEAVQKKGKAFRSWSYEIPTHLQYTPEKPLAHIQIENENRSMTYRNYAWSGIDVLNVWSESQEMLYATVRTNADCSGSIGLYCLGPRQEESFKDANSTTHPVKKEPVATLAEILISESRWVLGLEDVGEGLLVFIGEPDKVTAELYGYDGTLLDSNTMPSEEPVHEIEIQQTKWKDGRGVFVEGSQKTGENEYYVHFFTGYWLENGTIKPVYLNGNGYGTWTAVGKEKVLVMNRTMDEWDGKAEPIRGNTMNGFKISVYDITEDPAGKEVYCGELETDIDEDALEFFNYFTTKAYKQSVERQTLKSTNSSRQLDVFSVTESAGDSV
ncbi:hypothetical protein [Anaerotignum lactatifermentans]|uniref:hypothetical protein n=1 Tax=Anaerotignum lactatifermentans TaxID=160404 RepID=UPI0027B929B4|nr:hypothetical protein [Anaerotignum lactatifermentans]